jgi:hypothetical protein
MKTPAPRHPASADSRRPDVIVDFVCDDGALQIAIENIGDGPALDVAVTFDPPFRGLAGDLDVAAMALFRNLSFLAPRRRIVTLVDSSAAYFARGEPTKVAVTITYNDRAGARYEEIIRHDLDIYRSVISRTPMRTVQSE